MEYILETVECQNLKVDYDYQRPADERRVKKIADNWDDLQARPLILSMRKNSSLYVLDGNHTRLAALIRFGVDAKLPARIFFDLTKTEEAAIFNKMNTNSKSPTFNDRLKARYAAQEPLVIEYVDALNESGVYWNYSGGGKNGPFTGHSTGLKLFIQYGKSIFVKAMQTLDFSGDRSFLNIKVAGGICKIYQDTHLNQDAIVKVLRRITMEDLEKQARYYGNIRRDGAKSDYTIFAMAILDFYNRTKRGEKNKVYLKEAGNVNKEVS